MADKRKQAVDTLLHAKSSEGGITQEKYMLPFTVYNNVLCSPKVVKDIAGAYGAPFIFVKTGEEEMTDEEVYSLCDALV